jgi:hypothetical protein
MYRRVLVALCVVGLLAASVGEAVTTGRLKGTVNDNQGVPLPGVTVQISSPALIGGSQVAITGGEGGFVFNLLPVGLYTVEASLVGFQAAAAEVRVNLDREAQVEFNLIPEQFEGEVIVQAVVPIVDTAQVNTQEVFDQEFLQQAAVGTAGRDYLSIISQAAGVAGSGNASVMGGTVGDNSYLIDGLNTTDPLLGTFGTNFNYDAIQEISFQTGGFEAEFGQATGGIINLVTKSGGNEFSGSVDIRYRDQSFGEDGDFFNKDDQESSTQNYSATLGGPIKRDKVWFFVSGEYIDNKFQPDGAFFPWNYKGTNYIGKATWQMTDSHRGVFKYSADPAEIPGGNTSRFVFPDAKSLQEQGGDIWQAELNSVLSESLLLNAQVGIVRGYLDAGPENGDLNRSGHTDFDTLYDYNNYYNAQFSDRDRDEIRVNSTWFVDQFAGSHEFKAGIEYSDLFTSSSNFYPGDAYIIDINSYDPETDRFSEPGVDFNDYNGDGYSNLYLNVIEPFETARDRTSSEGSITTFFVQDAWRPTSNVTVKPGVRFDNVQLTNSVGEDIADMNRFQPRFGVAWDITGNAKYVLRGSWGRFMDPTALTIPNFASGIVETYNAYNTMEYYCNLGLPCDRDFLEILYGESILFTNAEGFTYTLFQRPGELQAFDPAQTLDQAGVGSLETPYADELIIAFETQIAPETSIEISYVDKKTKDIIEDTCSNNTWAWGDGARPSLDDSSTWTSVADCDFFMITNFSDFYREYEAYIGKFETRGEWWHLLFSWTHSESTGNTYNGARESYATALADVYALDFYNREGYMPDHRPNRLKLSGYVLLPYDITLGIDSWWSDKGRLTVSSSCENYGAAAATVVNGQQTVLDYYGISDEQLEFCTSGDGIFVGGNTIFLEPRGNTETEPVWNVDFQFTKAFRVGSIDMSAVLSVYNLIGEETADTFNGTAFRVTNSDFGDPVQTGVDPNGDPEITYYMPIGQELGWRLPRRYELGFRLEF